MSADTGTRLPPRWFVKLAWRVHRGIYRGSGGRMGLRRPSADKYGMMRLTTIGRRSGQERSVILAYLEEGDGVCTLAMNGWAPSEPAWWLNLREHPEAHVELPDRSMRVSARAAEGDERQRLWDRWRHLDGGDELDANARRRPNGTAVVVLEPFA